MEHYRLSKRQNFLLGFNFNKNNVFVVIVIYYLFSIGMNLQ